ncbi:tripartite tricarboxylate transporter substrate binding protein [Comamonas sp. GB3 AK4-5]|uniref:tripartite tricarboxylate transporter substrate binding protein n=1 Tax=Comamonas sp. GB3 AK4-5 TaxID=3231487 RepID=UPI00351E223A
MDKRSFVRGLGCMALAPWAAAFSAPARASTAYPTKPITLIQPYAPGGPTDQHLRVLAEEVGEILGQPVLIDSRPGANGVTAAAALTRAAPDGYTLGVLPASVYREPYINKVPFDPNTSFSYIALLSDYSFGLAVRHDAPWKTWADLVADAKKRPGAINIGATGGALSTPRIGMEEAMAAAGVKVNMVPYKGDADVVTAVLGGHIDASPLSGVAVPHITAGKMRYLVMLTAQRVPQFPDLPTLKESGVNVYIDSPYGVAGPKGMDPARVAQLSGAFHQALLSPAGKRVMEQLNQQPNYKSPVDYQSYAAETYLREKTRVAWMHKHGLL